MASAHELLAETRWHGLSLAALLAEEVAPFAAGDRVIMSGEAVILSPRAALPLALVVHELVANSAKYGALSVPDGRIAIVWNRDNENNVVLHWRESGGPPVSPPVRRGFGSLLIERSVKQEIGGSVTQSLFGWIAAQIPVQPHKCSTFGLRGVAVRMHWSTAADQPKSYESCLTVVTLIEGNCSTHPYAANALI